MTALLGFRDLGGLPAAGGRIRPGLLYRSGTPQFLDDDGARALLAGTGIRRTIDLRLPHEADVEGRGPLDALGVPQVQRPFVIRDLVAAGSAVAPMTGPDPMVGRYLQYLEHGADAVAGVLRALAEPGALPALVHCTVGRDRTGVAIAVVLSAVGVPRAAVAADYGADPDAVRAGMHRLRDMASYAEDADRYPPAAYDVEPAAILRFLDAVDDRYGGIGPMLAAHGAGPDLVAHLTDLLVAPPDPRESS